jgi:hypothetical protein
MLHIMLTSFALGFRWTIAVRISLLLPLLLWGCTGSGSHQNAALSINTKTLPAGQVGNAYAATLSASGGTPPLSWSVTSGALPAGLTLNGATGTISGTPSATAAATPIGFTVTDAANPAQTKGASLPMTISPAAIAVAIAPARAALTVTQTIPISATTSDLAGVNWSSSGGSLSATSSASGAGIKFTAPSSAGVYTITATSVTDASQTASITVGVTDLAGVYTHHNDLARDGNNSHEFALTPANVNTTSFGKLFSCTVDGVPFAQPLWVANLSVGGTPHNVIYVATAHDSLYAFDAEASPCQRLWQASLVDAAHGAFAGETSVPTGTNDHYVGTGQGSAAPEVGITGTPVIDPSTKTMYVVSKSMTPNGAAFYQRLHAIDITTGLERAGSPVTITGTYPGTGGGGTSITFDPKQHLQRASLALVNGVVYICWSSHEDVAPWYGWIIGYTYNGTTFAQTAALNVVPNNGSGGGIWLGGGAPAVDVNNNLYVITGNGDFDVAVHNYGDSLLKLNNALSVSAYFTPSDQASDNVNDLDFGAGGAAMVVNLSSGSMVVGGGKDGQLYLLNADSLGGLGDTHAAQSFNIGGQIFSIGAFWNNFLYLAPQDQPMRAWAFDPSTKRFNTSATSQSSIAFGGIGSTPSVSASGATSNGILWVIDGTKFCLAESTGCGPAVLHAYDATNLASELWNSAKVAADSAGNAVKFTVPTVVNGRVYVGTRGNNIGGAFGSTTIAGEIDVYGLKPN